MKLSKITEIENLTSVTISVKESGVIAEIFVSGTNRRTSIKKHYKSLDVDLDIPEISNNNVNHLGVKRYFFLRTTNFYINLYYY